jgi:hypothetical protein
MEPEWVLYQWPYKDNQLETLAPTRNSGIAGNNFIRIQHNIKCRDMAYIELNNRLPGITGLLENRIDTAAPIRELTQIILRGRNTLTEMEKNWWPPSSLTKINAVFVRMPMLQP